MVAQGVLVGGNWKQKKLYFPAKYLCTEKKRCSGESGDSSSSLWVRAQIIVSSEHIGIYSFPSRNMESLLLTYILQS